MITLLRAINFGVRRVKPASFLNQDNNNPDNQTNNTKFSSKEFNFPQYEQNENQDPYIRIKINKNMNQIENKQLFKEANQSKNQKQKVYTKKSLRGSRSLRNKKQNPQLKFTEQQVTQMSNPNKNLRKPLHRIIQQNIKRMKGKSQNQQNNQNQQEKPQKKIKYQKKISKGKRSFEQKFKNFVIMRPITRTQPFTQQQEKDQSTLQELSRIRLDNIFLPIGYLKKAQKIFHRYDQQQLREIAQHFSNYMALRYTEEKFNYDLYPQLKFEKLEHKVPSHKKVQQIYLIGQQKLYQQRQQQEKRKVDEDPTKPEISYTQNVAISYLLNRVPRTFASALRIFVEIKYKFPNFKPKSMIDFGSGLSSGSYAFLQAFPNTVQLYNVQPAGKMRKLSKYITQETRIQHYQTLGQLSKTVRSVDLVYAGYVINEIKPEMVEVYLQALYAKVKPGGLLVFCQYGNPFGARIIHQIRKWAINKKAKPVAPCPHSLACPLAKGNQWCHFDQPTGVYPKRIFGTLPTDQGIQLQKFSYIVIQKSNQVQNEYQSMIQKLDLKQNVTKQWDRVIFPTMKRGGHILLNVCTKQGKFQRRISSRSHGDQYKIAKRLRWGDLWRFSKRIPNKFRKNRTTGQKTW